MDYIEGIRRQLARLEENEECMHRIMDLLERHTSWFNETIQKLSGMEGIWRMVSSSAFSKWLFHYWFIIAVDERCDLPSDATETHGEGK